MMTSVISVSPSHEGAAMKESEQLPGHACMCPAIRQASGQELPADYIKGSMSEGGGPPVLRCTCTVCLLCYCALLRGALLRPVLLT